MPSLLLLTALGLTLFYLISKLYRHFTYWSRQGIPGFSFPTYHWALKPAHQFHQECAARFGKMFGGYRTTTKILWLNDARLARDMSTKELHKFPIRNSFHAGSSNINKSLFFMEANEDWKRIRSIVSPAFTSGKLRSMTSPIERIAQNFIEHLRPHAKSGGEFDMKKYIGGFTMDVIAQCGYGIEIDSVTEPNHPVVVNAKKILNVDTGLSLIMCVFFPTIAKWLKLEAFDRKAIDYFDELTFKYVEQRMASNNTKQTQDLLGLMIEHLDEVPQNGTIANGTHKQLKGLTKDEMSGQGILFFIAGFDTTHATFDHVIYYLSRHPEWQEKLYAELIENKAIVEQDTDRLKELPILNAIINEALRLNPPLEEIHREAKEDCELSDSGIKIPKDTIIIIETYVIHHSAEYFPDPDEFKPERFLDKTQAVESNFAFMPFGAGPRLCVGMRFAQNELRIGLSKLVLNYRFTIDPGFKLEYFNGSILMAPKRLMVQISER